MKNSVLKYVNTRSILEPNTIIGGVGAIITTPQLLANRLSISSSSIYNFSVIGNDVYCHIKENYDIILGGFNTNEGYNPTSYIDTDKKCQNIGTQAFSNTGLLTNIDMKGVKTIGIQAFWNSRITDAIFPECTDLLGADKHFGNNSSLINIDLRVCTSFGSSVGYNGVFQSCSGVVSAIFHNTMETINAGEPEGDIKYLIDTYAVLPTYL
ncbi:leucine-rich repeat protein [Wocania ichthyoenteri]|uniref:leucine-rich repeat protein n=1 Tax=Wocania ichthyoenteri TaxID=1230531 RepID=UPI00053D0E5A|nr:leucine-rich repeat protein [Wocania ichthyoenteri]